MKNLDNTHVVYNSDTKEYELIDLASGEVVSQHGHQLASNRFMYNLPLAKYICQQVAEGKTLMSISRQEGMPPTSVIGTWRNRYPDFEAAYKLAKKMRAENLHDTILEKANELSTLAPSKEESAAAKTAIDAWKWAAEKNDREGFGPGKIEQGASGPATIIINTGINRRREPTEVDDVRGRFTRREEGNGTEDTSGGEGED